MTRWSARVDPPWSYAAWREVARKALRLRIEPSDIHWLEDGAATLFDAPDIAGAASGPGVDAPALTVPKDFVDLAGTVLCHRDPGRFALLHGLLQRIGGGNRRLLTHATDAAVIRALALAAAVRRDSHKMKAFVRFREVPGDRDAFVAWFEPEHRIVDRVAPFFARRFAGMRWAILTPDRSVRWNGETLAFGSGAHRADAPGEDAREDLWRTYYENIFNPARLNTRMMRQEMAVRYWRNLPETSLLPLLVRDAGARVQQMHERESRAPRRRLPIRADPDPIHPAGHASSFEALPGQIAACRACPLHEPATQAVPGEGPRHARVMLVGEQPGDHEDLKGRPFVGPAGQLLDDALREAGIDRHACYLTNAVKHFRFERRGKIRLHRRPGSTHIHACRSWLAREIEGVRPHAIVCLGATAAQALFGVAIRLMDERGQWKPLHDGTRALVTVHPAWVLRQPAGATRDEARRLLVDDLAKVAPMII